MEAAVGRRPLARRRLHGGRALEVEHVGEIRERLHRRHRLLVVGEQAVEGAPQEAVDVVVRARDLGRARRGGSRSGRGRGSGGRSLDRVGARGIVDGGGRQGILLGGHVEIVDHDPLGVLRRRLQRDEGADVLEQLAEGDRLVDVVLGPGAQLAVLLEGLLAGLARHDHERHVLEQGILLQLVAHGEPVHPRELDGEQDEVGPVGGGGLEADVAVVDHQHGGPQAPELGAQLSGER